MMPPRPRSAFQRVLARFGGEFPPEDQHWIWTGATYSNGYGHIGGPGKDGGDKLVHVVVYEELVGPVPDGKQLDHRCRIHACCNPACLEPVTNAVNTQRGAATKLDHRQVLEILVRVRAGEPQKALAHEFGIRQATVSQIVHRKRWRNVHALKVAS